MPATYPFRQICKYCLILLYCCAVLQGCKKTPAPYQPPFNAYGKITVGGNDYRTVVIGSQTWTVDNFQGMGGFVYPSAGQPMGAWYPQYVALYDIVLPPFWRVPTVADFNKLTANVSKKADAAGNYTAGAEVATLVNTLHFLNTPTGFYYYQTGVAYKFDTNSAYYLTSDVNFSGSNGYNNYAYKLNSTGAGIVLLDSAGMVTCALLRFVKDN
ncbi:hypothetical protein [uncultured Mucilaginibacter sp.]|uniref:hypothetical protein n=1 Tax=uncultured Mucilaginibacter sp. TaxID=797541 RepID=UPI0025F39EFD|nr:hypothetical protein [uncultured Mucilaginibacter sp.]